MTEKELNITSKSLELLIKSFRLTLTNMRMYPLTSALVEQPMKEFLTVVDELLKTLPYIAISEVDGKIFVNSQEFQSQEVTLSSHIKFLVQFFIQSGIKSLTFKQGVSQHEIKTVLLALSTKKPKVSTRDVVKQLLQEKNITTIVIDEIEVITVLHSEKEVKNILKQLSGSVNNLPDLMKVLGKVYNELDSIKDTKTQKDVENNIAKYISTLDPSIIRDLFSQPLPPKIEESGLKQMVLNNLTKSKVEDIFNDIITWVKELKRNSVNEIEYLDRLTNLKEFIKLIINSPVSKLVPIEIFEELFKIGMIDILPEWVKNKEIKKSWITELDEILNTGDPTQLLQESFITSLSDNIEKLCTIGLDDTLTKVVEKMSENLKNPVIKIRQLASSSLNTISKQLTKYNKTKIASKLVSNLINLMLKEKDEVVLNQYFGTIKDCLLSLILSKNYSEFQSYGQQLIKYAIEILSESPKKSQAIYDLFYDIFDSTKEILSLDILSQSEENKSSILWFLNFVGEKANEKLLSILTTCDDPTLKRLILEILKSKKVVTVENIIKYLSAKTPSRQLNKILEILEEFDYDFSPQLKDVFVFTTYANKVSIINYFYHKPTQENVNWLIKLLENDEDSQVTEYVVDILTSLEIKSSVPVLVKLLKKTKSLELKKRICVSLGVLKEVESIDVLKKIIFSKPKFFGLVKGLPMEVRLVSCWSLSNFIMLPEVKEFFVKLSKSSEEQISLVAKKILDEQK